MIHKFIFISFYHPLIFTVFLSSRWVVCPPRSWCGWSTGNQFTQTCTIRCWCGKTESTRWSLILWHRKMLAHTRALQATKQGRAPLAWNWRSWVRTRWFNVVPLCLVSKPQSLKSFPLQKKRWSILPSSWKSCRTWVFLKELLSGWNAELWVCPLLSSSGRKTMTQYLILKRESRKQLEHQNMFSSWFQLNYVAIHWILYIESKVL